MLWIEDQHDIDLVETLSRDSSITKTLSKFLISADIEDLEEAKNFLNPKLAHFADPFDIPGMVDAVKRICNAIQNKENVLVIGDYDVDGITSTVIIKKILIALGLAPFHVTPKRKTEGYGLTKKVLNRGLKLGKINLVIALDCGTNSHEEAVFLKDQKIDLIIIDHHQSKDGKPCDAIQVNPHLHDDNDEPWRFLCTAGLAFKTVHGILKKLRKAGIKKAFEINPKDYLSLAGLGTIADLVPLRNENRILASFGLKLMHTDPAPGLHALLNQSNIPVDTVVESEDIAFKLAPRINACGRLDDPEVAISLLLNSSESESKSLAKKMNDYNEARKGIESDLTKDALIQAEEFFNSSPAVVVCGEGDHWNPGVVGIVAGKLANLLGKPCIVLAKSGDEYKGSGRGVNGVNLVHALDYCKEILTHWGGHPAAVGLSVSVEKIKEFKVEFVKAIVQETGGIFPAPTIRIAVSIKEEELRAKLLEDLNKLGPFGQANPEPILALKNIQLTTEPKKVGSGDHFQFSVNNGKSTISGIAWNMADRMPPVQSKIDLAIKLKWNLWNGRKTLQMILVDWRKSD
ncbi:MAG: single-stranded-DNA-specific exonuclease RecJ [Opitutae bacterium]|nr:single-stranded-DNA-specific exonuclease RecJ [Opitutae bacterium]